MSHEIRIPKKTNPDSMESFLGFFRCSCTLREDTTLMVKTSGGKAPVEVGNLSHYLQVSEASTVP